MNLKLLDTILLVVTAIGGFLALRAAPEYGPLTQEYTPLVQITGDLSIGDPKKLHLSAIDTGDPMHFAWRVYLPPNFKWELRSISGRGSSSGSALSRDLIARVRFRVDEEGALKVYTRFLGGSSVTRLGDERLATLLKNRPPLSPHALRESTRTTRASHTRGRRNRCGQPPQPPGKAAFRRSPESR